MLSSTAPAGAEAQDRHPSVLAGEAALDKPITYTETKIPLGELVQKVAVDTGVSLSASPGVVDEPVAVVVKQMSARELLEQLAELLDYRWTRRGKEDDPHYEIWQDLASKQREEALRRDRLADAEKRFREQLDSILAMRSLSPQQ